MFDAYCEFLQLPERQSKLRQPIALFFLREAHSYGYGPAEILASTAPFARWMKGEHGTLLKQATDAATIPNHPNSDYDYVAGMVRSRETITQAGNHPDHNQTSQLSCPLWSSPSVHNAMSALHDSRNMTEDQNVTTVDATIPVSGGNEQSTILNMVDPLAQYDVDWEELFPTHVTVAL